MRLRLEGVSGFEARCSEAALALLLVVWYTEAMVQKRLAS